MRRDTNSMQDRLDMFTHTDTWPTGEARHVHSYDVQTTTPNFRFNLSSTQVTIHTPNHFLSNNSYIRLDKKPHLQYLF
jgi:hypothetical protein